MQVRDHLNWLLDSRVRLLFRAANEKLQKPQGHGRSIGGDDVSVFQILPLDANSPYRAAGLKSLQG
jgi:hypothetical protein